MTPPFSARRRADEFDALVSRAPTAHPAPPGQPHADLLELVAELRSLPRVDARPEFVSDLRGRLMAEADAVLVEQPSRPAAAPVVPTRSRRRDRRLAAALGGLVAVGATSSLAVAAQGALPGESLYPLKRAIESAQVRMADGDEARGARLLADAGDRLTELEALAAGDARGRDVLIVDTLEDFTSQARDGSQLLLASYDDSGERESAEQVRDFTAESIERLDEVAADLPPSAEDALVTAARTMTDLDGQAASLCPVCSGGITAVPEFLTVTLSGDLVSNVNGTTTLGVVPETGSTPDGQDLTGLVIPDNLQVPETNAPLPDGSGGTGGSGGQTGGGTSTGGNGGVGGSDQTTKDVQTKAKDTGTKVKDTLKDTTDTLTGTTGNLTTTLDDATGGTLSGVTGGLDDATGGLVGGLVGGLDGLSGGLINGATGGVLPGP